MIGDCTPHPVLPVQWKGMGDDTSLEVSTLRAALLAEQDLGARLLPYCVADSTRPYGRNVLLESKNLEVMLATWTRGQFCAPHDHGGSRGVVQVLQGRARHRIYTVEAGQLILVREETAEAGDRMVCGRDLIHAMGDDGADKPLVTLHMYTGPVPHMVVYDLSGDRTLKVDGGCGAWVPQADSGQILASQQGMLPLNDLL